MKKLLLASTFALLTLTSCSKKEETTTYTPVAPTTTTTPSVNTYVAPTPQVQVEEEPDAVSSPTVLDESTEFGDSTFEVFFQFQDRSEFLLDTYPSVDAIIHYALSRDYVVDAKEPLDVLHQSIKESLGERYAEIRGNFSLLTRESYLRSEDKTSLKNQYSIDLGVLPPSWFTGIQESERTLMNKYLLDHYNINDLLYYQHYSGIPGMFSLFSFYEAYEDVVWALDQMSSEQSEPLRELLVRVLDHSDKISGSEQETYFTSDISAKDLLEHRDSFLMYFPNEIKSTSFDLTPRRIGYYHSGSIYGMTPIEHLVPERLYSDSLVTYSNITETLMTGYAESKTVQIYLPRQDSDANLVLTYQEIYYNEEAMYGYFKVETTRTIDFNVMDAMKLHSENEATIEFIHDYLNGVPLDSPTIPAPEVAEPLEEESQELEEVESSEETESLDEAQPSDETESPEEVEPSVETESPEEVEPSVETDSLEESEPSAETDSLEESEPSAEADSLEESEPSAETEPSHESAPPEEVQTETADTSEPVGEAEQAP